MASQTYSKSTISTPPLPYLVTVCVPRACLCLRAIHMVTIGLRICAHSVESCEWDSSCRFVPSILSAVLFVDAAPLAHSLFSLNHTCVLRLAFFSPYRDDSYSTYAFYICVRGKRQRGLAPGPPSSCGCSCTR